MRARPGHPGGAGTCQRACACMNGLKIRSTSSIHAGLQGVCDVQRDGVARLCMGAWPLRGGLLADLLATGQRAKRCFLRGRVCVGMAFLFFGVCLSLRINNLGFLGAHRLTV